jgi:hypothetical protein
LKNLIDTWRSGKETNVGTEIKRIDVKELLDKLFLRIKLNLLLVGIFLRLWKI